MEHSGNVIGDSEIQRRIRRFLFLVTRKRFQIPTLWLLVSSTLLDRTSFGALLILVFNPGKLIGASNVGCPCGTR